MDTLPLIVDIKRHSLEDGPGIRSVVFFKGCPLQCVFCHNPETQDQGAEIAFSSRECIRCGECAITCPNGAIDLELPERIHREKCLRCGQCAGVCPGRGLRIIGIYYSIDELTEVLMRDHVFYRHSGGGITLSGGECTIHPNYLESLLKGLKERGIHIVLETSGYFNYDSFRQKILPYLDIIYYDIKIADPQLHKKYLGRTNNIIFHNLYRLLDESGVAIYPRIPLVPGITATRDNLAAIVDRLCDAGAENVSLLPYNPMGFEMTESLGKQVSSLSRMFMKPDEERAVFDMFNDILEEKRDLVMTNNVKHTNPG